MQNDLTSLRAVPTSFLSWDFNLFEGGVCVAHVDLAWFRENGTLRVNGEEFEIGREGLMSGSFFLRKGGRTIASAKKESAFLRRFAVRAAQKTYTLKAVSPVHRRFVLVQGTRVVGEVRPDHLFSRKATVDLPAELPLETRIFMTWLVVLLWRRQRRSN